MIEEVAKEKEREGKKMNKKKPVSDNKQIKHSSRPSSSFPSRNQQRAKPKKERKGIFEERRRWARKKLKNNKTINQQTLERYPNPGEPS